MYSFISKSEEDTKTFACKLASKLNNGDLIVLSGDLGSGKTKFTEGFLSYFGLSDEISSPTFTIVNEYKKGDINIFHFDVYRLNSIDEFYAIGGQDYFSHGICIIEWGEQIIEALPKDYILISFERDCENDNYRKLNVSIHGNKYKDLF